MKQTPGTSKDAADKLVTGINHKTRKHYSAEEKIPIVLAGLRGEENIAALCRREGIATRLYYGWSRELLEAGKKRLAGDTVRQATSPEIKDLRAGAAALKEAVANLTLENRLLEKACWGRRRHMGYQASDKLEFIRLVELSHLPVKRTLDKLGIPKTTFYRQQDRYQMFGELGLEHALAIAQAIEI
ncbi:Transposase [Aliiruegeria lutimaris]|uniref:Transposase n=1 Tax=Aliiruegeria lutimaris TaxID=571298 RepID=A0A1G8WE48_9RHOB|nr:Transposase [Aliiruegeria lutimaris]